MRAINYGPRAPNEIPRTFWVPEEEALDGSLCSVCRRLDIRALLTQPPHPPEYAILGLYVDIRNRSSHCRFCKLIVSTIAAAWKTGFDCDWDSCSNLELTECGLNHSLRVLSFPLPPEAAEVKIRTGLVENSQLDLLGDDALRIGITDTALFRPRIVPGEVAELSRVKEWIHICEKHHGNTCGSEVHGNTQRVPKSLRVIDVEDMRLVSVASKSFWARKTRHYVALSYVWGYVKSIDQYKTTISNFSLRTKKRGLHGVPFPRTIRDAIEVTRRLGERYIWVDAICIIQDSSDDKSAQISSMHIIYGAASLTIVAAGGEDADCPLPRSCDESRHSISQYVEAINGLHICRLLPNLWDLENTPSLSPKWFSRGWTYQERHLSNRLLLFTQQQVYFQCRTASHSEGLVTERYTSEPYEDKTAPSMWGNNIRTTGNPDPYFFMNKYRILVQEYTVRNLGVDSDALNAFMGVGIVLTEEYGDRFSLFYGLPGPDLEEALTWQPAAAAPMIRRSNFPSWSWAGWRGPVKYRSPATDWMLLDGTAKPLSHVISEFRIHMESGSQIMPSPLEKRDDYTGSRELYRGNGQLKAYAPLPPVPTPQDIRRPTKTGAIPPGTLQFIAAVVPAESFGLAQGDEHSSVCHCFDDGAKVPFQAKFMWRVVDRQGFSCGMMGNGIDSVEGKKLRRSYICIARSGTWGASSTCLGYNPNKYQKADGCCWEVLLVEYAGMNSAIAQRVAAGRIHEDAWAQAEGLRWEEVLLC